MPLTKHSFVLQGFHPIKYGFHSLDGDSHLLSLIIPAVLVDLLEILFQILCI